MTNTMKNENILKACESFETFFNQLRVSHKDAVDSCDQFAEIVLYDLIEEAAKIKNQLGRIGEALK